MTLAAGQNLSFYEILGPLGAGGMGEVYRARDTRLEREVAIKVLPDDFADDEERLRRFEREAKTLASLNHPNVASIYGVDQVDDICFLALELVPGEDLAQRLARGPLPIEEALETTRQIAEGLEAAHEAGVVHRDLKPANVRVTPAGTVKVLDFGLAKTRPAAGEQSSTDSVLNTAPGLVLGTPTYMAPEQARGRPIDRRVDLWALGCVLYECLSGKRAFDGASLPDVIGAVLEREPDWAALPARTPARVRELVERCLSKDPRKRLRDAGDARLELECALEERAWLRAAGTIEADGGRRATWAQPIFLFLGVPIAVLGLGLLGAWWPQKSEPTEELRLSIDMRVPYQETYPRISPDGRTVVHEGLLPALEGEPSGRALFRRDLDSFESLVLPGTENPVTFSFSPDGAHLAALVEKSGRGGELTVVRVSLADDAPTVRVGAWPLRRRRNSSVAWVNADLLVGSADPDQLVLFQMDGGSATHRDVERAFDRAGSGIDVFRSLGDGRHVLGRTNYYDEQGYRAALVAIDVDNGKEKIVTRDGEYGSITSDGELLFTRGDVLFRAPFDPERIQIDGPAVPIASGLRTPNAWRSAWFDMARNGTLIWLPGGKQGTRRHVAVLERSGHLEPLWPERMLHDGTLSTAPDGSFFTSLMVTNDGLRVELWGSPTDAPEVRRIQAASGTDFVNGLPLPGGRELIYQRISTDEKGDGIYRMSLDGSKEPELIVPAVLDGADLQPVAVSPDEEWLVFARDQEDGVLYSSLSLRATATGTLEPLFLAKDDVWSPKFSDDGRWIAHVSTDIDRSEVFVQRFRAGAVTGPKLPVPTPDGETPWDFVWSRDPVSGLLEFLMVGADRHSVFSVPFEDEEAGRFGPPKPLATIDSAYVLDTAHLPRGRMLVLLQDPEEEEMDRISVVIGALSDG